MLLCFMKQLALAQNKILLYLMLLEPKQADLTLL